MSPPPKPDDIIYVPDCEDESRSWKFHGGWAAVGRVVTGLVEQEEKVWISVKEFGALTFEWPALAKQQDKLKEQYNWTHAGPR